MPEKTEMKHFSHPHGLHLSTIDEADETICSGCEKFLSGYAVTCTKSECNFLHQSCYELSRTIKHPSCSVILVTNSPYEIGEFMCAGCGDQGRAFYFHSSACKFDLDVSCALRYQPVTRATGRILTSTAVKSTIANRRNYRF